MDNVLIGDNISKNLFLLNSQLNDVTLQKSNLARNCSHFSPWHCNTHIENSLLVDKLVEISQPIEGGLLTKTEDLNLIKKYLKSDGNRIIAGMPHKQDDWLPLTELTVEQVSLFEQGKSLLLDSSDTLRVLYKELIKSVVILDSNKKTGYSSMLSRGIIFRSIQPGISPYEVAMDLAHELGHQVLFIWQSVDPIITSDPNKQIFSEIRKANRPSIQTFHAAVALSYMLYFSKFFKHSSCCQKVTRERGGRYKNSLEESLSSSIATLEAECEFSPLGKKMLDEMKSLIV